MGKCVLKLTIFSEAVCVTYNLLNIQVLHPGAGQQLVEPGGFAPLPLIMRLPRRP